jgi:hypothetical protein
MFNSHRFKFHAIIEVFYLSFLDSDHYETQYFFVLKLSAGGTVGQVVGGVGQPFISSGRESFPPAAKLL